jgi:hypothetical protein
MLITDSDDRYCTIVSAQRALNGIAESPEGARAVVDANVFDYLPRLLNSWSAEFRKGTAELLGTLAKHDFGLKLILNSNLCAQFVSLLRRVQLPILDLDVDGQTAMTRTSSFYVHNER